MIRFKMAGHVGMAKLCLEVGSLCRKIYIAVIDFSRIGD